MDEFRILEKEYGKSWVKLLHVKRDGLVHSVREYEVDTKLTLNSEKDFREGDNSDIIPTDTQKNTVYLLAMRHGVGTPEQFATILCRHFLDTYAWVVTAKVRVEAHPWKRIKMGNVEHNHAFISTPVVERHATVTIRRNNPRQPEIISGLKNLRVLKTTQSGFVDFNRDDYTTLPEATDRIFSTIVQATWKFASTNKVCFDQVFDSVFDSIIEFFAGEPHRGLYSASVQQTIFLAEKKVLLDNPQVQWIWMAMPNKHYFSVDLSKFPRVGFRNNNEVFLPVDKPSGMIEAKLGRKDLRSRL